MSKSQKRAIEKYRSKLSKRGLVRFEVLGREKDRDLVRAVARRLAEDGPHVETVRSAVALAIVAEPPKPGGIVAALRRSPLAVANLGNARLNQAGRKVSL
jgi:hypothetical protein